MDFWKFVFKRNIYHALAGGLIGFGAIWLPGLLGFLAIGVTLVIILIKEILFDPHKTGRYWIKTIIDLAVWTISIVGVFLLVR